MINAKDFIYGNIAAQTGLEAAIHAACFNDYRTVILPAGEYLIGSPIELNKVTSSYLKNITIKGVNAGPRIQGVTRLIWMGGPDSAMFKVLTRGIRFEGIEIIANTPLKQAFIVDSPDGQNINDNKFTNIRIDGSVGGRIEIGVQVGQLMTNYTGLADNDFVDCEFKGCQAAFVIDNDTGQSKLNSFTNCRFMGTSPPDQYEGVAFRLRSGNLTAHDCLFFGLERILHSRKPTDHIALISSHAERCKRAIDTTLRAADEPVGAVNTPQIVSLIGGSYYYGKNDENEVFTPFADGDEYNGEYIYFTHAGIIRLDGVRFGTGSKHFSRFRIHCSHPRNPLVAATGCSFPSGDPVSGDTVAFNPGGTNKAWTTDSVSTIL